MQKEFINQYGHAWRVFKKIVQEFDSVSWSHIGRKNYTPARLSFHMLQSVKYYIEDKTSISFASGKSFMSDWTTAAPEDLPSQEDILVCIEEMQKRTEKWLAETAYDQKNTSFDWAGETRLGIVIFSLRHFLYHLGELSCLLNESKNGNVDDLYVNA